MQREPLDFIISKVSGKDVWPLFAPHHYMSGKYNGHHAWIVELDNQPVAFSSIIAAPSGYFKNGWRGHRTVVLPEFQGLGLGPQLSDWTAHYVVTILTNGQGRYFSKTLHPRLGEYRQKSPLWRPTRRNLESAYKKSAGRRGLGIPNRVAYAHEYIGHLTPQ